MSWISRGLGFARTVFQRERLDGELDEELRAYVDALAERKVAAGMDPAEARRAALLETGGVEGVKEEVRAVRAGAGLVGALDDARHAWRCLRRRRGFVVTVALTLGLGIGASTAIFSVVHALLLTPLPFPGSDRLVFLWSDLPDAGYPRAPLSGPELHDLRAQSRTITDFGGIWATTGTLNDDEPEQVRTGLVTADFFSVLGARPLVGRTFLPGDEGSGAPAVAVLSGSLWQRRFGGDPSVVGRRIHVNNQPLTVVGVMPEDFRLSMPPDASVPDALQMWVPFPNDLDSDPRALYYVRVVGRLAPGVSLEAAAQEIESLGARLARLHPEYAASGRRFYPVGLHADGVRPIRPALLALFAAVGVLLLIAFVNVATLLVARAASRTRETALAIALGAGRARLFRQCVAEGLVLAGFGALCGIALGALGLRLLDALKPASLARIDQAGLGLSVLLFAIVTSAAWAVLFSLAPLREMFHVRVNAALQQGGRWAGDALRSRTRALLVSAQVALSVVLLVNAGLLARALHELQSLDPGFRTDDALTFRLSLAARNFGSQAEVNAFSRRLERSLRGLPGVHGVGAVSHVPYDELPNWSTPYRVEGVAAEAVREADARAVSPGFFGAVGVRLLEGRLLKESDDDRAAPVVVVDERLAGRAWPGRPAVGQRLILDDLALAGAQPATATVVGVVRHLRHRTPAEEVREQVYVSVRQTLRDPLAYVVRANDGSQTLGPAIRAAVAGVDETLPVYDLRPFADYAAGAAAERRFVTLIVAFFAVAATALACLGVYGIVAYGVARRRHEFGVRLALGARPAQLLRDVLGDGLRLAGVGLAAGLPLALVASRALRDQLFTVPPHDPATYLAAGLVLAGVALVASLLPGRRVLAVSATQALRAE